MSELVSLVTSSLSEAAAEQYLDRVTDQAEQLKTAIADGEFDNPDFAVGLEMEVYGVDNASPPQLTAVDDAVFEAGATKELGVHNAEINTDPDVLDADGLARQADRIAAAFDRANTAAARADERLVTDAMWTLPPSEGGLSYLTETTDEDGITLATNMRTDSRYCAIDNDILRHADGEIVFSTTGITRAFPSILFESLATSIQPHLQIPDAESFPAYFNAAIRTMGPLVALAANSPFLPPELYTDTDDPERLVDESHHELRIAVFEQSVNQSPNRKVRVPRDIETVAETVDRVVNDDLYAPFLREWLTDEPRESVADDLWEFTYKRSTYWRWLRCVVGGDPVGGGDERSLRIEYRPIPTQPTIADTVGLQWLTVGLITGLVETSHPLAELPWADAEESFYNAARDGLDAELAWLTADGDRTTDHDEIFGELFDIAETGLASAGVDDRAIAERLDPLRLRIERGVTPSAWKKGVVREELDAGADLDRAITTMQERYIDLSRSTDSFTEWL